MFQFLVEDEMAIDTSALDCIQANLAAAANAVHETRGEDRLGAALEFRPRPTDQTGLLTIERTLAGHLATAGKLLGLEHTPVRTCSSPDELIGQLSDDLQLVLADAFDLRWVPYYGQSHTSHSFLLRTRGDEFELADAYTNDTPYGSARPKTWTLTRTMLRELLPAGPVTVVTLRAGRRSDQPLAETVDDLSRAAQDGRVESYAASYANHPDQAAALTRFTVETWLLARQRVAFARWLASVDNVDHGPAAEQAGRWLEAAESVYLAMRRAQRGKPVPEGVVERIANLLREDGRILNGCTSGLRVGS